MRIVRRLVGNTVDRWRGLSTRDRRALLLGLAVLAPALGWAGVARPYLAALSDMQERVQAERALLERERAVLQEAHTYPDRIAAARHSLAAWEARLVDSPNLALAEAEFTAWLEELARESRVLLESVQSTPRGPNDAAPPDGLRAIRLTVDGESDFEGVLRLLHRLEAEPLLVRVVGLSLDAGSGGGGGEDRNARSSGVVGFAAILEAFAPEPGGPLPRME